MCLCQRIIIIMSVAVTVHPVPNSWPPKLKSYDIWGAPPVSGTSQAVVNENEIGQNVEIFGYDSNQTSFRDSRVLNFFPLPVDDECKADDGMRSGICLNTYECRIQGGTSKGQCALGFGVCCVFTATCDQEVFNNITYIVSPSFPALMAKDIKSCKLKIKMISSDVSQLRLDFVHFTMGQPNRTTGICDGDVFMLSGGATNFSLCGQNHGQHIYYDVPAPVGPPDESLREEEHDGIVELLMDFSSRYAISRLFEIKISQIPFSQRAPAGCMQYFTDIEGIIQTFNFAENGRHLANQDYRACVRQEEGMCSIQYQPCFEDSFKIGPNRRRVRPPFRLPVRPISQAATQLFNQFNQGPGQPGVPAPSGGPGAAALDGIQAVQAVDAVDDGTASVGTVQDMAVADQETAATQDDPNADAVEGSGGGADTPTLPSGYFSFPSFPSFFTRGIFGGGSRRSVRQFENEDDDDDDDDVHNTVKPVANPSFREGRQFYSECTDRITLPCVVEDFIAAGMGNVPNCLPIHCGDTLCDYGVIPCKIESTVKPFGLGIHFGEGEEKGSPEENIGACLRYNQMSCT